MARIPPKIPRPGPSPRIEVDLISDLSATIEQLARHGDTSLLTETVAQFWQENARTPIISDIHDGQATYTFLWRDERASSVLLFANRITDERRLDESVMSRIAHTDIWHISYRLSSKWRASYGFIPTYDTEPAWLSGSDQVSVRNALDRALSDPGNPQQITNRVGTRLCVVCGPDAPAQRWLNTSDATVRGSVQPVTIPALDGQELAGWWYESYGVTSAGRGQVPLVIAFDGATWTQATSLPAILDELVGAGQLEPVVCVLVDSGSRENRWDLLGDPMQAARTVAESIIPWARSRRESISADSGKTVVVGQSLGGLSALMTSLLYPEDVGCVVSQSASLWMLDVNSIADELPPPDSSVRLARPTALAMPARFEESAALKSSGRLRKARRAFIEVGSYEWVLAPLHRQARPVLERFWDEFYYREYVGGHDDACWRGGIADGITNVLGT